MKAVSNRLHISFYKNLFSIKSYSDPDGFNFSLLFLRDDLKILEELYDSPSKSLWLTPICLALLLNDTRFSQMVDPLPLAGCTNSSSANIENGGRGFRNLPLLSSVPPLQITSKVSEINFAQTDEKQCHNISSFLWVSAQQG